MMFWGVGPSLSSSRFLLGDDLLINNQGTTAYIPTGHGLKKVLMSPGEVPVSERCRGIGGMD